ncbi:MAG TPA: type II toxin-antitoxin system HicB family antitoxin [Syntrophorhabdales bacterium]|nr:type II toxin-antitoxin system HicB family antitoxin [Syntrophorhabdales bacterium]
MRAFFSLTLPVTVKKKAKIYISSCPCLDVYSQGQTEEEAEKNLGEALKLFLISCYERGTLDEALKECGFAPEAKKTSGAQARGKSITVPIPLHAKGSCAAACRA